MKHLFSLTLLTLFSLTSISYTMEAPEGTRVELAQAPQGPGIIDLSDEKHLEAFFNDDMYYEPIPLTIREKCIIYGGRTLSLSAVVATTVLVTYFPSYYLTGLTSLAVGVSAGAATSLGGLSCMMGYEWLVDKYLNKRKQKMNFVVEDNNNAVLLGDENV